MEDSNNHTDPPTPVGKLLKQLPKVTASPDFEARLQRRIVQQKPGKSKMSVRGLFAFPWRIPVVAGSLIAFVAVGIISFYILREGEKMQVAPPSVQMEERPSNSTATGETLTSETHSLQKDIAADGGTAVTTEKEINSEANIISKKTNEQKGNIIPKEEFHNESPATADATLPENKESKGEPQQIEEVIQLNQMGGNANALMQEKEVLLRGGRASEDKTEGQSAQYFNAPAQLKAKAGSQPARSSLQLNNLVIGKEAISPADSAKKDSLRLDSIKNAQEQLRKKRP